MSEDKRAPFYKRSEEWLEIGLKQVQEIGKASGKEWEKNRTFLG